MKPNGYAYEADHSDESNIYGDHETARSAKHKPEQRSQDLTTIEWIDGENVEREQPDINSENPPEQDRKIRRWVDPGMAVEILEPQNHRRQRNVHQRSCGDAPKRRTGPRRGIDIRHAPEWPEHDAVGRAANLPAG